VRALIMVTTLLAGCALFKQGAQEAKTGVPLNTSAIPQGKGWQCYTASNVKWSGCYRAEQDCVSSRQKALDEAKSKNEDIKFGPCQPALQASCFTYEDMKMQPNGSAKWEPAHECMPDPMSCEGFQADIAKKTENHRVSNCSVIQ
jgi:hypothetical protein